MPIVGQPGRTISTAVDNVQNLARAKELGKRTIQSGISNEVIEAVLENGAYRVVGRVLYASGDAKGLLAGMIVPVAWRNGEPQVILSHNARRAQFTSVGGAVHGVVEELMIVDLDVWFRNEDQIVKLFTVPEDIMPPVFGGQIESLQWGRASSNFFVLTGFFRDALDVRHPYIDVYRLNRPSVNDPFLRGVSVRATRVRLYDLLVESAAVNYGTMTIATTTLPATASDSDPLTYTGITRVQTPTPINPALFATDDLVFAASATISCLTRFQAVMGNGDLIVAIDLRVSSGVQSGGVVINDGVNLAILDTNQLTFLGGAGFLGTMIVNATKRTVLNAKIADSFSVDVQLYVRTPVGPPAGPLTCRAAGTVSGTVTPGVPRAQAGLITVLSATVDRDGVTQINNYAFVGPPRSPLGVSAFLVAVPPTATPCYSAISYSALTLTIVGEFAQTVGLVTGGLLAVMQDVAFQTSRTRMFWRKFLVFTGGNVEDQFYLTDLKKKLRGTLFGIGNYSSLISTGNLRATQVNLIYARGFNPTTPYDGQFFVAGDAEQIASAFNTGFPSAVPLDELKPASGLAKQAIVKKPITPQEIAVVTAGGFVDVQVLNSRFSLKGLFQPGPL